MFKTITEISLETGIPIPTLRSACQEERLPARKSGRTWLIDIESEQYREYRELHRPHKQKQTKEKHPPKEKHSTQSNPADKP